MSLPNDTAILASTIPPPDAPWIWGVIVIMFCAFFTAFLRGCITMHIPHPRHSDDPHDPLVFAVLSIAFFMYFVMPGNIGWILIDRRQVWVTNYLAWALSLPALLFLLFLFTSAPTTRILILITSSCAMVVHGFVAAIIGRSSGWLFYLMALLALSELFVTLASILGQIRRSDEFRSRDDHANYRRGAIYLSLVLSLYPVVWVLADGLDVISLTAEAQAYAILNILLYPVFCYVFILYPVSRAKELKEDGGKDPGSSCASFESPRL